MDWKKIVWVLKLSNNSCIVQIISIWESVIIFAIPFGATSGSAMRHLILNTIT